MVEDLIKRLRDEAGFDGQKLLAANALEQQAARITALESERDALLAAAGKEAVGEIAHDEVNGFHFAPSVHWLQIGIGTKLYTAPTAALEKSSDALYTMDQMRDYADGFHRSRLEAATPAARDNPAPVAWFHNTARDGDKAVYEQVAEEFACYPAIPLYSGPVEPISCQACGDGMKAHDPGICGNCFAMKYRDAPTAAPEKGDGRDAERGHWNPVYNTDPVQRACGELPEGWEIQILLERDAGCVYLIDPNGERSDIDNADKFDWTIHEAIDAALSQKAGE